MNRAVSKSIYVRRLQRHRQTYADRATCVLTAYVHRFSHVTDEHKEVVPR
jgi:hypothetical protein